MNTGLQNLKEDTRYVLSLREGNLTDCIYEGICGNKHCFTTKKTEDEWVYYFLAEGDFRTKGQGIEVLVDNPNITRVSRFSDPVEFAQIEGAWKRAMQSK